MGISKPGLQVKDLIIIGVFTALLLMVITGFAILMSGLPIVALFTTCVEALLCGGIFFYIVAKIPKFGAITIIGILVGLFFFIVGHFWLCLFWMPLFTLIGDFVCKKGRYKSFKCNVVGYALFCLGLTMCACNPMLFFVDDFVRSRTQMGITPAYIQQTVDLIHGPLLAAIFLLTVAGAVIGAYLGKMLLRKHFAKAGII